MYGEPAHWCAACGCLHVIPIHTKRIQAGDSYLWNGNRELPTFNTQSGKPIQSNPRCRYRIHNGVIGYSSDCQHELAGKESELVALPEWVREVHPITSSFKNAA